MVNFLHNAFAAERHIDARQARRMHAEDRYLGRQEKREAAAYQMVGELCREGQAVFYINVRNMRGALTGATREFTGPMGFGEAVNFLIRNHYV